MKLHDPLEKSRRLRATMPGWPIRQGLLCALSDITVVIAAHLALCARAQRIPTDYKASPIPISNDLWDNVRKTGKKYLQAASGACTYSVQWPRGWGGAHSRL